LGKKKDDRQKKRNLVPTGRKEKRVLVDPKRVRPKRGPQEKGELEGKVVESVAKNRRRRKRPR